MRLALQSRAGLFAAGITMDLLVIVPAAYCRRDVTRIGLCVDEPDQLAALLHAAGTSPTV